MSSISLKDSEAPTSISRPISEADNFYRARTLDLIGTLKVRYDLDAPRL